MYDIVYEWKVELYIGLQNLYILLVKIDTYFETDMSLDLCVLFSFPEGDHISAVSRPITQPRYDTESTPYTAHDGPYTQASYPPIPTQIPPGERMIINANGIFS